jgi:hypothetical protein
MVRRIDNIYSQYSYIIVKKKNREIAHRLRGCVDFGKSA